MLLVLLYFLNIENTEVPRYEEINTDPPRYEEHESLPFVFSRTPPPPYEMNFSGPTESRNVIVEPYNQVEPDNQVETRKGMLEEFKEYYYNNKKKVVLISSMVILVNLIAFISYRINKEYILLVPFFTFLGLTYFLMKKLLSKE